MMPSCFVRSGPVLISISVLTALAPAAAQSRSSIPANPDNPTIVHVLNRTGFGPRPGDVERVRRIGLDAYIEQQLRPDTIADERMASRLASLETLGLSTRELAAKYYLPAQQERRRRQLAAATMSDAQPQPLQPTNPRITAASVPARGVGGDRRMVTDLQQQKVLRAAYGERQLEEVMADFWFNHFNVFAAKGLTRLYLIEYERDVIRPRVFGKFRDLLGAVAESPAMLFFLDNWQSSAPQENIGGGGFRRGASQPRARSPGGMAPRVERQPGAATLQARRSRGLNENYARELMELHTLGVDGGYTQKDVQEIARAFTGWTIEMPRQGGGFIFNPRMHEDGEKLVLGHRIKPGGGRRDGEQVLDVLARHPSTARFIAAKLARRFVADEPPAALVARAAARFTATDGDIREVVRTILMSPEFFAPAARRAKFKTPFEFVVSAVRATGFEAANGRPLVLASRELGMPLYMCQPPTGYADRAEAWINTGTLLNRMNFAVSLSNGSIRSERRGARTVPPSGGIDVASTRDALLRDVLAGEVSASTDGTVQRATSPAQVVALVLGSPDFQKR
jgi:uncharacterized protein (DUF1800 family)